MSKSIARRVAGIAAAAVIAMALLLVGCGSSGGSSAPAASGAASTAASTIKTNGPTAISAKAATANSADKDGVLTVGFDQEFPPYGYIGNDGVFTGVDLELAAEVAARNGWDLNCVPINWDGKDNELNSGAIDCIWNGFTIEGREDGYAFTEAYMNNSQVVVVRKDAGINTLADLSGKIVITQADSAALALFVSDDPAEPAELADLAASFAELRQSPDYNNAFMELEQGTVNAVAIDLPVALFQIQGKEDTFMVLDEQLSTEHFGVGFAKGNEAERDAIQATLKEMTKDGTAKQIVDKYEEQGVTWEGWCLEA